MARVTNRARAPRGFATVSGRHVTLAPGQSAVIDIPSGHPVHDAWVAAGEADIEHDEPAPVEPAPAEERPTNERKRRGPAAHSL